MEILATGKVFATNLEEENARLRDEIAQLKANAGQLRLVADFSPALISYVDREERYRFMNRLYTEWFGFETKEVIGKTVLEVVGTVAYEKAKFQIRDALQGNHVHFENSVVMKNGDTKVVDLQFVPFQESTEVNGFIILGYDITDRKKAELELVGTQKRLEFALESAKMTSWYLDLKTNQVLSTPGSKPLWGYEVKSHSLYDVTCVRVHPDDIDDTFRALSISIRESKPYQHEYRQLQPDGTYRWVLSRAMPQYDEFGSAISISGVMVDITEQKQIRENLAFLAEASAILSSSLDYSETFQRLANVAVPNLANWCSVSVLEKGDLPESIAIAHPDPEMMKVAEEFRTKYPPDWNSDTGAAKVLRTGKPELHPWVSDEVVASVAKDPEHLRLLRLLKIRSVMIVPIKGRTQVLGILTLISSTDNRRYTETDLTIAEEIGKRAGLAIENARLFTQAQDAVRLRDEFFSIASHELKTPITSLKLQVQLNQRRLQKEPNIFFDKTTLEKLWNTSSTQLDRLSKLVDEMLDISRISHGKLILNPEEVDLGLLVKDVVSRFHGHFVNSGCNYQVNVEERLIGHWDRYRIEQVITNLITNAIKYGAGKPVEISVLTKDKCATIAVKDYGIGIAYDNLDKIFDRFERAANEKNISGLGLGLYISRQIVEAHRGKIQVTSELTKGSTFTAELPLAR